MGGSLLISYLLEGSSLDKYFQIHNHNVLQCFLLKANELEHCKNIMDNLKIVIKKLASFSCAEI